MRALTAIAISAVVALIAVGSLLSASAPPGATARCRDGTYSFSKHHSGTCSHHGGVAAWLTSAMPGATTTFTSILGGSLPTALGKTVLLAPRTRSTGGVLGPNPDRRCSPGAYYAKLTKAVICSPNFRPSTICSVPTSEKHVDEIEYRMAPASYGTTLEIDYIVSLELGGSNATQTEP